MGGEGRAEAGRRNQNGSYLWKSEAFLNNVVKSQLNSGLCSLSQQSFGLRSHVKKQELQLLALKPHCITLECLKDSFTRIKSSLI